MGHFNTTRLSQACITIFWSLLPRLNEVQEAKGFQYSHCSLLYANVGLHPIPYSASTRARNNSKSCHLLIFRGFFPKIILTQICAPNTHLFCYRVFQNLTSLLLVLLLFVYFHLHSDLAFGFSPFESLPAPPLAIYQC